MMNFEQMIISQIIMVPRGGSVWHVVMRFFFLLSIRFCLDLNKYCVDKKKIVMKRGFFFSFRRIINEFDLYV